MSQQRRRKQIAQNTNQAMTPADTQELTRLLSQYMAMQGQNVATPAKQQDDDGESEINLVELFWRVISKFYWIVLSALIGTIIAAVYAYGFYVPQYSATSKLYIVNSSSSVINLSDLQIGTALATDYQEVFKTHEVSEMALQILADEYGVEGYKYTELQKMISISNPSSSRVIYLTAVNKDATLASQIADAYALAGQRFITERMRTDEPSSFSVAMIPGTPSTRSKTFFVVLGFAAGTLLAMAVIVILFLIDDKPRTAEDIMRASGLPTLGTIPMDNEERQNMIKSKRRRDARNRKKVRGK